MSDTTKRILSEGPDGTVVLTSPAPEFIEQGYSIIDIANKDLPKDTKYIIVESSDETWDRDFRDAWSVNFSNPTGVSTGKEAWKKANPNHGKIPDPD